MSHRTDSEEDIEYPGRNIPLPKEIDTAKKQLYPFSWYKEMRDNSPVRYDPYREVWDIFRYDDIKSILAEGQPTWSTEIVSEDDIAGGPFESLSKRLNSDPPYHEKARSSLKDYFGPDYLNKKEDTIQSIIERQVETVLDDGNEFDFRRDFARPIPIDVIAHLLGVPIERWEDVREWTDAKVSATASEENEAGMTPTQMGQQLLPMYEYIGDLVQKKRENPQDDILSVLTQAEWNGKSFSDKEIIGLGTGMLSAGNITTVNFLTNTLWTLYEEDILDEFVNDDLNRRYVLEEVIRYRSPAKMIERKNTEPIELRGETIPEGERLELWLGSANRDERQFDNADSFIPERRPNPHLAFGHGSHFCIGASLARMEVELTFDIFFDKVDDITVDLDSLSPPNSYNTYTTTTLPVSVST